MQSVRGVLRQSAIVSQLGNRLLMQSVRGVLRQRTVHTISVFSTVDAIRAGCAEAKVVGLDLAIVSQDAIRAGCSETNGRALYSNDHAQNNEINRKESYPIQSLNQIALFYE